MDTNWVENELERLSEKNNMCHRCGNPHVSRVSVVIAAKKNNAQSKSVFNQNLCSDCYKEFEGVLSNFVRNVKDNVCENVEDEPIKEKTTYIVEGKDVTNDPRELLKKILMGVLNGSILFMLILFGLAGLDILLSIILFDEISLGIFIAAVLFCVIHNIYFKK